MARENKREIRMRNIPPRKNEELRNVASYYGYKAGEFWRTQILQLLETFPEHIRKFRPIDETIDNQTDITQ